MGTIEPYATQAGKRFRVRYRTPDQRQTDKRGFTKKRDAELFLALVEVSKARGTFIDAAAAKVTIGTLGSAWHASRTHLKPSTAHVERINWRIHVEPRWGRIPVSAVSHTEIQSWVAHLDKSPSVVRACAGILSAILEAAVRDKRIHSNPAKGVRLPRKIGKASVYLTHGQVQALANEAGARSILVMFLAYSGLRWGEATGLRVRNLDLLKRRVNVTENAVAVGGRIVVGTPKSSKARSVPIPAFLSLPLTRLCEGKNPDGILFGDGKTHQRSSDSQTGWFVSACARVRKSDPTFPEHLTLHDLRHTAASLAISAGANVKAIQRMLGHASAAMTLDTYADLFEDDLDAVAAALNQAKKMQTWVECGQYPPLEGC
jgi:integrase